MKTINEIKQETKTLLSTKVLSQISDKSVQNILRTILFDETTDIDWSYALDIINEEMPELKMENTYWNSNGKYQQKINKFNELMPSMGYTTNDYMNLFITISKVYYRKYNDGDSIFEFDDRIRKYVRPFSTEINFDYYKDYDGQDLEELVNGVIEFIKNKDLSYQEIS